MSTMSVFVPFQRVETLNGPLPHTQTLQSASAVLFIAPYNCVQLVGENKDGGAHVVSESVPVSTPNSIFQLSKGI